MKSVRRAACFAVLLALAAVPLPGAQPPEWWHREPVRLLQTNLPESASTLDPVRLVDGVADFGANVLLLNMGGIAAQYPTEVPYHFRSRWLPAERDFFGDALRRAHARGLRVIGRFDLSKTRREAFDAHPEWFFRRKGGGAAIYNGLYSTCINGDYYREQAVRLLTEALTRYPVDGVFFNMFGNPTHDYDGVPMGPCQCRACARAFEARHDRALPQDDRDPEYRAFMHDSARAVAERLGTLIHRLRPEAAFLTYIDEHTDVVVHESNTSVARPLPLWPYSASDNVNRSRNSGRRQTVFNLCMSFVDYPWRFIHVSPDEVRLRLFQNLAHGGPPALVVVGGPEQEDRTSLAAARPVFAWHAKHEDLYVGQESAARVLLLHGSGGAEYRGFFRMMAEAHVPFAVSADLEWLEDGRRDWYDLVIAPEGVSPAVEDWVSRGGRLLVAGPRAPSFAASQVVAVHGPTRGAWRVHDRGLFPALQRTNLVILDSEYAELASAAAPALSLIPPAMSGPPELVWLDKQETKTPGVWMGDHGRGRVAWLPWRPGEPYYRYSSPGHAGVVLDLVNRLLPSRPQLRTDAHPLVEITVMRQPARRRTLVHLVNLSGHSSTAYWPPLATGPISVDLAGSFTRARAVKLDVPLALGATEGRADFTIPVLHDYEVVVLE